MNLTVGGGSVSDIKTLETGQYDAMCVDVVYPVVKQYNAKEKPKQTVMFIFEINKKRVLADGSEDERNYLVFSKNYTITLTPKSHLLPLLTSWLGVPKLDAGTNVALDDFYRKPAKLMVTEEPRKSGSGTYAQIVKVSPSDLEFETDPNYERKDPKDFSDVEIRDEVETKSPF